MNDRKVMKELEKTITKRLTEMGAEDVDVVHFNSKMIIVKYVYKNDEKSIMVVV